MADATATADVFDTIVHDAALNQKMDSLAKLKPGVYDLPTLRKYVKQFKNDNATAARMENVFSQPGVTSNFKTSFRKSGNPDYQMGMSRLNLPGSNDQFDIPNAALQAFSYMQNANQGRADTIDRFFGRAGEGQFVDRNVLRSYLQDQAPNFQGAGSFNRNRAAQGQIADLNAQRKTILGESGGAITEQRTTGGAMTGGNAGQIQSIDDQIKGTRTYGNSRAEAYREAGKVGGLQDLLAGIEKRKATTSNLPIVERVIK